MSEGLRGVRDDERAVLAANEGFYRAFESLDLDLMDEAWWHTDDVLCAHPGWELLSGWREVRRSWAMIFRGADSMRFVLTDLSLRVAGEGARVVLLENLVSNAGGQESAGTVLATNLFERREGLWRMVHHHGSAVPRRTPPPGPLLH